MTASVSSATGRLRRGWDYYRRYTTQRTGIHAAATAALTGFGLLAYFEQWFVAIAIASYLLPPIYLYLTGDDLTDRDRPFESDGDSSARGGAVTNAGIDSRVGRTDADSDFDGADTDLDGTDSDTDGDDGDTDADGTDTDADSDSDG